MAIRVSVLYFGQARDAAGVGEEELTLSDRATVATLLGEVLSRRRRLEGMRAAMQVAVNEEIAGEGQALADGDVVALLPPVAGG